MALYGEFTGIRVRATSIPELDTRFAGRHTQSGAPSVESRTIRYSPVITCSSTADKHFRHDRSRGGSYHQSAGSDLL